MTPTSSSGDPFATPGFRFYPTEEELLSFYLHHRLAGTSPHIARVIPVVDVYSYHPSELRSMAGEASVRDAEQWFFFCPRAVRELHGGRPARTTPSGYWKATGSPSYVFSSPAGKVIGVKRTMVFYQGRAPTGTKTRWKMNEYKLAADATDDDAAGAGTMPTAPLRMRTEFSLCRVYVNVSTGTLRSFDRRPLNPPGHDHALHRKVPSAAITDDVIAATQQIDRSHGSSPLGAMGIIADDAAIDWSSLITAAVVEDFSFDCTSNIVGAPHPQIR